jgi:hypothetical protein
MVLKRNQEPLAAHKSSRLSRVNQAVGRAYIAHRLFLRLPEAVGEVRPRYTC